MIKYREGGASVAICFFSSCFCVLAFFFRCCLSILFFLSCFFVRHVFVHFSVFFFYPGQCACCRFVCIFFSVTGALFRFHLIFSLVFVPCLNETGRRL